MNNNREPKLGDNILFSDPIPSKIVEIARDNNNSIRNVLLDCGIGLDLETLVKGYEFDNENNYWVQKTNENNVNHPSHYTSDPSGVECITITEHRNFCIGNAIKYLWRAGLKIDDDKTKIEKQIEDLQKATWYINREIERLKKVNNIA